MATINDFGIPEVITGILQPKLRNRWRATFANMGGGSDSQPVSAQVITFARPSLTFDQVELHRYNSVAYVAGKHSWETLHMSLEDDISGTASGVIQNQLQSQQFLIGAEGQWLAAASEGSLYKFVTYLDMLDGGEEVVERWTYEGCWIMNSNYGDLDYASTNESVKIELEIRFDHARQSNLGDYSGGPGIATGGVGRIL